MSDYRTMFIPAIEKYTAGAFTIDADSVDDARKTLAAVANYTLYLHSNQLMHDFSNTGWIEQFIDGEWQEVDQE